MNTEAAEIPISPDQIAGLDAYIKELNQYSDHLSSFEHNPSLQTPVRFLARQHGAEIELVNFALSAVLDDFKNSKPVTVNAEGFPDSEGISEEYYPHVETSTYEWTDLSHNRFYEHLLRAIYPVFPESGENRTEIPGQIREWVESGNSLRFEPTSENTPAFTYNARLKQLEQQYSEGIIDDSSVANPDYSRS